MLRRLRWPLKLLLLLLIGSMLSVWSWGRFATRAQGEPSTTLATQSDATALDRLMAGPLLARPGDSGAALVTDNVQAFALRAITAREAGRSLDAMYYIWRGDLTGNLLKYELLAAELLFSARERSWLMSPYFVPGDPGVLLLTGQAARGVDVKVITNSLAATDVPVVHAGYQHQREPLLSRGVRLYELKPSAANINREILGSSGASLHTKAFVIDGRRGFVGSFNFDPRSAQLNTEMGVLFDHAPLAAELEAMFVRASEPDKSWRLSLGDAGALRWHEAGQTHSSEPLAPRWLRALVHLLGWLPIESQL